MKHTITQPHTRLLRLSALAAVVVLILIPFHAFLTVWLSSVVGHYTLLRLWKEGVLLLLTVAGSWLSFKNQSLRRRLMTSKLMWLIAGYICVELSWGAVAYVRHAVTAKALSYGLLVNMRFLLFFAVVWIIASQYDGLRRTWHKVVLIPAGVVIAIGLLQRFILPHDVLRHFGYGHGTIPVFETIDHKVQYVRTQSTLRGANLLGAYLIIVLAALCTIGRRWWVWLASVLAVVVLFCSGSRGAWIGAVVAGMTLFALAVWGKVGKRWLIGGLAGLALIGVVSVVMLRHNDTVQNILFHTDEHSRSAVSSNSAHLSASEHALVQIVHEPLGRGPGTAGPASVYNHGHPSRIAENYFLQIGQEVGWLGLVVFLAFYSYVGRELWCRRDDPLARSLFASLLGLTCVAMLMHIWTDDTIAYLWWGLAGIALVSSPDHLEVGPLDASLNSNNRDIKHREN